MPRILIAGCGYVGEAAADFFFERGWQVEGWTASAESAQRLSEKPYAVRGVDIGDAAAVGAVRSGVDVVIQCVSSGGGNADAYRRIYLAGARTLLNAFSGATLIFTSSTSVYAQKDGLPVDESSLANPLHESGRVLRETEELALGHRGIVARLGGIYGPGRSHLLRKFLAGEAVIDLKDTRFINQAHRDDIVQALFFLAERRAKARGEIYNVVDDHPASAREIYDWLAAHLKRPLPVAGDALAGKKRGESDKRVSNRKLRALGWAPRYPSFREAMRQSILPTLGY